MPPGNGYGMPPSHFDPTQGGHTANGVAEELLTGDTTRKVRDAALAAVPGGTVQRVETDAEGAKYEAHMTKSDGTEVTVKVDTKLDVSSIEAGPRSPRTHVDEREPPAPGAALLRLPLAYLAADEPSVMDDIEAIKQLKARYCRTMDTKDWTAMREVFADDVTMDTTESGGDVVTGADDFMTFLTAPIADVVTVHQCHTPEIELRVTEHVRPASGRWRTCCAGRTAPSCTATGTTTRPTSRAQRRVAHRVVHADPATHGLHGSGHFRVMRFPAGERRPKRHFLVGVPGFEPGASASRNRKRRLTADVCEQSWLVRAGSVLRQTRANEHAGATVETCLDRLLRNRGDVGVGEVIREVVRRLPCRGPTFRAKADSVSSMTVPPSSRSPCRC